MSEVRQCHVPRQDLESACFSSHRCMSKRRISPTSVAAWTDILDCHDSDLRGLPRSVLRDFIPKLTFVPAGHGLSRPLKLRALTHTTYFYIDPRGPPADPALRFGKIEFKPRLFFYDHDLWETAVKLRSQVENPGSMSWQYAEALGNVLTDRTSNYFSMAVSKTKPLARRIPRKTIAQALYRDRFCELRARSIDRPFAGLGEGQLLRSDKSDIGDAYKAQ
jgi:hypothetical protein